MILLTDFLQRSFYHNSIEAWLISGAIIVGTILLARLAYWIISRMVRSITSRTETKLDDLIIDKMERPAVLGIILIGLSYAVERLHFTDKVDLYVHRAFVFLIAINLTWFLIRIVDAVIEEYLRPYAKRDDNDLDDQMILLIERGASLVLWTVGIIVGLNNAGFDVGALIAGLGIGGLALALAAQDTVKNIFGGVMVFIDKPFSIGDRIRIDGFDGFVHYIGIRSTRIKTLEGRIVTIPNAHFSDKAIENVTIEPSRRVVVSLGLVYNTPPDKLDEAIAILKAISDSSEAIITQDTVVFFETFNAHSLDVKLVYFIKKESDIFITQTEVNKQILARFNAAGLEFAFPTRTIYNK